MTHLRNLNLNLLPILQAILRTGNITRASEQLNMSQSAVSDALSKLRLHFKDELLLRSGRKMVPTSLAQALLPQIDDAAERVSRVFGQPVLDPASIRRRFILATPDAVISVIGRRIVASVQREAPGADVQFIPLSATTRRDQLAMFDLMIGPALMRSWGEHLSQHELYEESFVCIMRKGHPLSTSPLTRERYWSADHAAYRPDASGIRTVEDEFIAAEGGIQREVVRVPNFWLLAKFVETSDCLALMQRRLAVLLAETGNIVIADPPFATNRMMFYLFWDAVHQNDPEHRWFRGLVTREARVAADIEAPDRKHLLQSDRKA
ncbi:probable nodulation protein [Sphingobium indicum BiD32]|uniref:Probable nodulation protein n=1 Tax=Sphingobium indicum BiD32 TaxID=1301087 RepID=N1MQT9_9SPHN|nr:LysR family transcriptional regulator [Sphingobium indicum]CCW17783.1 probable nodulation protein [Sphingobium indicum BiD32]